MYTIKRDFLTKYKVSINIYKRFTIKSNDKNQRGHKSENDEKITEKKVKTSFSSRLLDYFINPTRYHYIDKTDIISRFVQDNYTDVIIKPPNYGKSFSLNLLKYFLTNNTKQMKQFFQEKSVDHLHIPENSYQVITLNLGELDGHTLETNLEKLHQQVISNFDILFELLSNNSVSSYEKDHILNMFEKLKTADRNTLIYSVKNIAKIVLRLTGKYSFLLIDDYDFPLINAAKYGFYDQMLIFLDDFLSATVKNNDHFYKTIITATTPTEINKLFSSYKNLQVHPLENDDKYKDNFGLSYYEITQILNEDSSMNLLKERYSNITNDNLPIVDINKDRYSFTEVISSISHNTEKKNVYREVNVKDLFVRLSNEASEDNSNIKFLCDLTLRSLQIVNNDSVEPIYIEGVILEDLNFSKFDSKLIFSVFYYNALLRKISGFDEKTNKFDIKNYSVAKHILECMPKESEFSNFQSRFILNYYLNINYSKVNNQPNLQGFLDYLKNLSSKKLKAKSDFPVFRTEKELKNFFSGIFMFDPEEFICLNTLENPAVSTLQIVISKKNNFAIVFDCKKITKQNKASIEEKSKLMRTLKMASSPNNYTSVDTPSDSETEVRPEIINELKVLSEDTFNSINIKESCKFVLATKFPINYVFVLVLSNYQRQFDYKLEILDLSQNITTNQ